MWITFTIALTISITVGYFFFTASDRRQRILEGVIATGSMMVCLAIAPLPIKVLLLLSIFALEQWRVQWEKAH
ncbi:MAG: hypothetical protein HC800_14085 [Phormidesmis sp. RL_2_1]|nr:hypothetical protein [Phormidesmis sp. RL_2_1]